MCDLFLNVWNPRVAKYSKATHQEGTTNPLHYMPEVSVTVRITLVLPIAPGYQGTTRQGRSPRDGYHATLLKIPDSQAPDPSTRHRWRYYRTDHPRCRGRVGQGRSRPSRLLQSRKFLTLLLEGRAIILAYPSPVPLLRAGSRVERWYLDCVRRSVENEHINLRGEIAWMYGGWWLKITQWANRCTGRDREVSFKG